MPRFSYVPGTVLGARDTKAIVTQLGARGLGGVSFECKAICRACCDRSSARRQGAAHAASDGTGTSCAGPCTACVAEYGGPDPLGWKSGPGQGVRDAEQSLLPL